MKRSKSKRITKAREFIQDLMETLDPLIGKTKVATIFSSAEFNEEYEMHIKNHRSRNFAIRKGVEKVIYN